MTTWQQPPRLDISTRSGGDASPTRRGFRFRTLVTALVLGLLVGGIAGFLVGQGHPTDTAVRQRIAERMVEVFEGAPSGAVVDSGVAAPEPAQPAAVTVGRPTVVNFGGTEDAVTFTVTSVTRRSNCPGARDGRLVLQVDLATGPVFNRGDMPFSTFGYVDRAGVTHPDASTTTGGEKGLMSDDAPSSCTEALPYGHEMKPGARYAGSVVLDLPADATLLTFGTSGFGADREWSLPIPTP